MAWESYHVMPHSCIMAKQIETFMRFGPSLLRIDENGLEDHEDNESRLTVGEARNLNSESIQIDELKKIWISRVRLEKYWTSGCNLDVFKGCFVSQRVPIHVKHAKCDKLKFATNVRLKRIAEIKMIQDAHGQSDPSKRSRNLADCRVLLKVHNDIREIEIEHVSKSIFKAKEFDNFRMHCAYYSNTKWPTRDLIKMKSRQLILLDKKYKEFELNLAQKQMEYQKFSPNNGLKRKYISP